MTTFNESITDNINIQQALTIPGWGAPVVNIRRWKTDGSGKIDRGYQNTDRFDAPWISKLRINPEVTAPLTSECDDANANPAPYFFLFANGPLIITGTHYLVLDINRLLRVCDGSDIHFTYDGSTDSFTTLQSSTTISVASNNAILPQSTINVASTTGFSSSGIISILSTLITYAGITGTSFTGCSGGSGTLHTGNSVVDPNNQVVFITPIPVGPGNTYTIALVNDGPSTTLAVTHSGNDFTIHLGTDGSGNITSTASDVASIWNGDGSASSAATASFTGDGSGVPRVCSGSLRGHPGLDFHQDASAKDWFILYNDYNGTDGGFILLRIYQAAIGSVYADVGDSWAPEGPSVNSTLGNWTGAISLANSQDSGISSWFSSFGTQPFKVNTVTFPSTVKSGQLFAINFTLVDSIDGSPYTGGVSSPQVYSYQDAGPGFSSDSPTGSGTYVAANCQFQKVGTWPLFFQCTRPNPIGVVRVTPGTPSILNVLVPPDNIISNGPITDLGGEDLSMQGLDKEGNLHNTVGVTSSIAIEVLDPAGNRCTNMVPKDITVSLEPQSSPGLIGILLGILTVSTVNGVARFNDLVVTGLDSNSRFRFTMTGGVTVTTFAPIGVVGIVDCPLVVKVNNKFDIKYTLGDWYGNKLTPDNIDAVSISNGSLPGIFIPDNPILTPTAGEAIFTGKFTTLGNFNLFLQGSGIKYPDGGSLTPTIKVIA